MAITINYRPFDHTTAHNDMLYSVASDNTGEGSNFKYVAEIHINGGLVAKLVNSPTPGDGYGEFDIAGVVRDWVSTDFEASIEMTGVAIDNPPCAVEVVVEFAEQWEENDGSTHYSVELVDDPIFAVWGRIGSYEFKKITESQMLALLTGGYLTHAPEPQKIGRNERAFLRVYADGNNTHVNAVVYRSYDAGGAQVTTETVALSGTADAEVWTIASGTSDLADVNPDLVGPTVVRYTVEVLQGAGTNPLATYIIDAPCRLERARLHFINQLGGIDSVNFDVIADDVAVEERTYERQTKWGATELTHAERTYYADSRATWRGNRTFNSLAERAWLVQLVQSPEVYWERGGEFVPVKLVTKQARRTPFEIDERGGMVVEWRTARERVAV